MPWKRGQSGNPGGRPKVVSHVRELARQHSEEAVQALCAVMNDPAEKGTARVAAAQVILDRAFGKPAPEADLVLPPFDQWTDDMVVAVFGPDAAALLEAREAEAQQELLPAPIEAAR